ncbi:MAG: TetR/AcrR family transcriptional regulator [Chloroflexota bacterium]
MSPRTREQNEEIRQARGEQIMQAARRIFAEQGFHAARMSDIAQAIGVSQGTLYHYFRSKDELFLALLYIWNDRLAEIVRQLPNAQVSSTDKFWMINQIAVAFFETSDDLLPVLVEFWAYALRNPDAAASFRQFFQTMQQSFIDILNEGITAGEFKPIDVEMLSIVPLIVLDGISLLTAVVGKDLIKPVEMTRKTQQLIFGGLLVNPERASL